MGKAILSIAVMTVAEIFKAHPGHRVLHEVRSGGMPADARVTRAWLEQGGAGPSLLCLELESACWPDASEGQVSLPPLEMRGVFLPAELGGPVAVGEEGR